MSVESANDVLKALLQKKTVERTAGKMVGEDAVPAGEPGGPSITPDPSDLTPTGPSVPGETGSAPQQGGSSVPPMTDHRPPMGGGYKPGYPTMPDDMMVPPRPNPFYIPTPYPTINMFPDRSYRSKIIKGGSKIIDPAKLDTFDDQVEAIANNIRTYVVSGRLSKAVTHAEEWVDGVIDEDGTMFPETRVMLEGMSKNALVSFIGELIRQLSPEED